jgi:hypothetical protein
MVSIPKHRKLLLLYFRYKDSPYYLGSFIFLTVGISVLLLFYIVIPQVFSFFSVSQEVASTRDRITVLKNNITYLASLNNARLDSDLRLAFEALPADKDFAAIIDAINIAALDSGVEIDDYSVLIGELATPSAQLKQYHSVDLVLAVGGNKSGSKAFLKRIYSILPLSQVKSFSLTEDGSTMKISFYFKPFPKGTYKVTEPIGEIPPRQAALFNTLSTWSNDTLPQGQIPTNLPPDSTLGNPF